MKQRVRDGGPRGEGVGGRLGAVRWVMCSLTTFHSHFTATDRDRIIFIVILRGKGSHICNRASSL
jgi:hypothetical protein